MGKRELVCRSFAFMTWLGWLVVQILFCRDILNPEITRSDRYLRIQLIALAAFSILVLLQIILSSLPDRRGRGRRLSLIGGFILGAMPLGVAALGFATSLASVREIFNADPITVDLSKYNRTVPAPLNLFIGLDTSKSVLRSDERMADATCAAIQRMLLPDESLKTIPQLITRRVKARIVEFSDKPEILGEANLAPFNELPLNEIADNVCDRVTDLSDSSNPGQLRTDVLGFLEDVQKYAVPALKQKERVAIIVISDLIQDKKEVGHEVEERLRLFAESLRKAVADAEHNPSDNVKYTRLSFMGLVMQGSHGEALEYGERRPIDLNPLLEKRFPGIWRRFNLEELLKLRSPYDRLRLIGATSAEIRVDVEETLYLKFTPGAQEPEEYWGGDEGRGGDEGLKGRYDWRWAHVTNAITAAEPSTEQPQVAFQLRARPDRGTLPGSIQLRYRLNNGLEAPLTSNAGEVDIWSPETLTNAGTISVRLASHVDSSRAERLEFLVLVPDRAVVYAIPAVILPTPGPKAAMLFKVLVWFFLLSVVALCLSQFVAACSDLNLGVRIRPAALRVRNSVGQGIDRMGDGLKWFARAYFGDPR